MKNVLLIVLSICVVLFNPSLHNADLVVDDLLSAGVGSATRHNKIGAVDTARYHLDGNFFGANKGASRPELTRHGGIAPGVKLSICPNQALCVCEVPSFSLVIRLSCTCAFKDTRLGTMFSGKVETTLTRVILGSHQPRDNGGPPIRRAVLPIFEAIEAH